MFLGQSFIKVEPNKVKWIVGFAQRWNPPLQPLQLGTGE